MTARPFILITPCIQPQGYEFDDLSLSLSDCYARSIAQAGGIPFILSRETDPEIVAECVRRADGVLLTGGEDVQPRLYRSRLTRPLAATVKETDPVRDAIELQVIDEVFRQKKPLLAICRGHQLLNVALGGTLLVDIPSQRPDALEHRCSKQKDEPVHEILLKPGSRLRKCWPDGHLRVNSSHHQAVDKVAPLLEATGFCPFDGIVEVLESRGPILPYLLSVQFHPERLVDRHAGFLEFFSDFTKACCTSGPRNL